MAEMFLFTGQFFPLLQVMSLRLSILKEKPVHFFSSPELPFLKIPLFPEFLVQEHGKMKSLKS